MSQYEVELRVGFSTPQYAGRFASACEGELGHPPERDGAVVTCLVRDHGTEAVLRGLAEELGGDVSVKVLVDDE